MNKEKRKTDILRSVLKLVNRVGFYHINMKKIADEAGIAPGTIYLYFKGKETLINDLYEMIIKSFNQAVLRNFSEEDDLKDSFYKMISAALDFYLNDPDKFSFVEQYTYAPFLFKETREANFALLLPIFKLVESGKKRRILRELPDSYLLSLIYGPLNTIIKLHLAHKVDLNKRGARQRFYDAVWSAVSV